MKHSPIIISPMPDQVDKFKAEKSEIITVTNIPLRVKVPLRIESTWRVNYDSERIHFITLYLRSYYEKLPLSPLDLSDRHLRAVRKLGSTLFGKKRFDGLVLFETKDPSIVYHIFDDGRPCLFAEIEDARLWLHMNGKKKEINEYTKANDVMQQKGQKNSILIRNEALSLMIRATRGVEAMDRLRMTIEHGCRPHELETIWRNAHGVDDVPENLRSIIYGDKEETKI